jgi:hypothetical protein
MSIEQLFVTPFAKAVAAKLLPDNGRSLPFSRGLSIQPKYPLETADKEKYLHK